MSEETVAVRDRPELSRYEIHVGDALAGFAAYTLAGEVVSFTHTETEAAFAGRGLATRLVTEAMTDVRGRGRTVRPFCPFVRRLIAEHPDRWLDLVAPADRAAFDLPTE